MAFSRKFLTEHGVPEDQVDAILAERNRTLGDYIPKEDVQAQIDTAVEEALKGTPQTVNVRETEEYKALQAKYDMTVALGSEDFTTVKPKFRETVYGMLDHSKSVAEQLPEIAKQYEEYFTSTNNEPPAPGKPQFGSPDKGSLPGGEGKKSLGDLWGFHK